jgi:ferric-dicitrate binding protein FerR (iron transport regulator)
MPWSRKSIMFSRWMLFSTARALLLAAIAAASLAPLFAQTGLPFGSGAAKLIVMSGRVSVIKDGAEWARNVGDIIQPQQTIITGPDGYAKFELPDGSTFEVFKDSRAVFHETPGWQQLLNVVIGRVKVYIDHRNGPNHQRVTTQTAIISVRGTIFDVVVEDQDATTLVSVDEGIVEVSHLLFGGKGVELHPGESIRVFRDQRLAQAPDKGAIAHMALRAAAQAVYDVLLNRAPGAGGAAGGVGGTAAGGSGGGSAQGDKGKPTTGGNSPPPPP